MRSGDVLKTLLEPDSCSAGNANLKDYASVKAAFSWSKARELLDGLPGGGLNIAYEAVDRHVLHGNADRQALLLLRKNGTKEGYSYGDLARLSNRFANILTDSGVERGEAVFSLLGRCPELYIAALGTWKHGSVFSPLFSAFGPEPIRARMEIGKAKALITSERLYLRKIAPWRTELPHLEHVFLVDCSSDYMPEGTVDLSAEMDLVSEDFEIVETAPEDRALLHFTSGTTGRPKGAIHVHEAVVAHHLTGRYALDLHPGDIYWCTADPGWVTGTSYGIISPLTNGVSMIVDEAEFDTERWYGIVQNHKVNVWYSAPTAIRRLMRAGAETAAKYDLTSLRFLASVGEPLNPEAVLWSARTFGRPFHDNWWQTETGGIMIANYAACPVKPGSMGRPMPGIEAEIVQHRPDGSIEIVERPMVSGELALKSGWPSMMRGYLGEDERYRKCFTEGWYLSGDLAMRDADGYYWFVGRADDVIKTSGHLVGPFEVESALMEHSAVAEVGVVGIPDETAGEIVKAYVGLKPGVDGDDSLRKELLGLARKKLGPAVAPREIAFRENLPKTRSGKIMRRLLRARELGLPEGDISTLESDEK